ncbi:hypothetical protein [Ferruginibacter sp. HRS2-29]|uniref:hypothetical protein n=1 Tax=Ferruginibacter sp. HRS2-29 TaxID=2487334 RepID=UPI0020CC5C28|nr:hypothetical protein [Ferruginibacter sp. HRS2-29]MCP9753060.1 hypothetical protein [Ferruginibacter sp. HRS2-29]
MRYWYLLVVFNIYLLPGIYAQEKPVSVDFGKCRLESMAVYMVCKGTRSKIPIIGKEFNLRDTNITHVGLGWIEKGRLIIYNMVNDQPDKGFRQDSIADFLRGNDIYYWSIWKTVASNEERERIRKFVSGIAVLNPKFDNMFDLDNGDSLLYCSEFCKRALFMMAPEKYSFPPVKIPLNNPLYESILDRKILTYIPVDFFQGSPLFEKIYEQYNQD